MDFNDFLADLRTAGNEFSEKISDKYAATMAYCETACKCLDRLERDAGPYENQVIGLWVFLGYIQETYPKLTSGPAINALCQKIFRHCARTVLNIQWQQLDENSTSRQNFEVTLQGLNQCLSATGYTRFALILSLMDSGWTRPILSQVMGGEEDTEDGEGLNYIINEDPVILKIRVEMMLQENCEEFALNLCSWCLKHPALKDDLDIRQTQLMLFHKLNNSDRLQEECQKIPCHDGVRLISRMRQMEKYKSLCTRLAQIFLVQDWIRQSEHCCTKDLLKLWIRHQYLADRDKEKFLNSVWAIAKLSSVTEQILLMIDALKLECGDMFLQLYTDLCIFAINFDKSCLEKHMQDGDMEGLRTRQQAMASTCEKLANVYLKNDTKITRYSAVTSFALNPSAETLSFVEKFYLITTTPFVIDRGKQTHEDEKCCTNCFRGEGTCQYKKAEGAQSDANVDIATLLEVERLLNMLRPFYLNPDMQWTELKPLCEKFLHERERLAQKFAMEMADTPSTDDVSKSITEPVPSKCDHPAPSSTPPASALIQTSSTPVIQQQKLQPSQTLLVKSEKPSVHLPQNIVQAFSSKSVQQNVSKTVSTQNIPNVSTSVLAQKVPQHLSKSISSQPVRQHLSKPVSATQNVQQPLSKSMSTQNVPHLSKSVMAQNVQQPVSKSVSSRPVLQHTPRPMTTQNVPQPVSRFMSNQQVFAQPVNRSVSRQHVSNVSRPVSTHYAPHVHVARPLYTQHIAQQSVTSGSYTSPITASSQQSFVQQDTSSLIGIEPSVMLSEDKNLVIRNLLFSNEEIALADFPDADALVELLQQALPGGGTELPETLQDISIDNTGIVPALHIVQDLSIPEQMKRTVQTDSNYVSIYSTPPTTAQAVGTSLRNTSYLSGAGGKINPNSLTHSLNLIQGLPVSASGMSTNTIQSAPSNAADVSALLNLQTGVEMSHTGIQSSGHSLKQPVSKSLSYVAIVTQAGNVTTSAPSHNMSVSRSNIPIQPRVTQSTVLRPGVAGVAQQGIGAGQHIQAMMTKNVPNVSSQTLGTIRMAAMGSQMEHKVVDTSVQSLHLSSLPGKPVVTPKSYPNVSSSSVHSDTTVAQNTEQIQLQQQSVSSLTQNSLKNLLHQQSMASLKAANAQLHAQQIVSGSGQKSGQTMSFDPKHLGNVQRTVKTLVDQKQGENVCLSQELMQNILSGGAVQVIPSSSSMMIGAPSVANMLQTPAAIVSQSPTLLYTAAAPSSLSMHQSVPNITEYNQGVSSLEINQQALHASGDLPALSSVIALLNLQSQAMAQTNAQSTSKPKSTKTLKTAFNEFQKNKPKKRNPSSQTVKPSCENANVHVKSVENSSKEATLVNRLNFGTSIDMPQEPLISMHLHSIPASFAPPPSASVLEQPVTCANEPNQSVSAYGQTTIHQQNTTAASSSAVSAALFQHLQSTRPTLVQQGQQLQHVVGALPQHLQQSSLTVMPSTGQTQNSVVQQAQTIFIPAVGQQNTAAVFQPATVGQLTLVHQVPNETLFSQTGILQPGIQVTNLSQIAVSKETSTQQINKHSPKSIFTSSVNDMLKTSQNSSYDSVGKQTSSTGVLQPSTTSISKAHVPFMLASRLCSSSSKKYMSTSQSKCSQNSSKPKPHTNVKDLPATNKAADFSPLPISSRSSEVSNQLERFLLNSVLPKQSNMTPAAAVSSPLQNVQGQFQHGVQSSESLHTQSAVPHHTIKYNTYSERSIQPSSHIHLGQKSDTLSLMDCLGISSSRSSYIASDGAQVPVGFTQQYVQPATPNTNGLAMDNLNNALHVLATKNVQESVQEKYSDEVVDSFFSENEGSQHTDLLTLDEPYLIENVSSRDLVVSEVYDTSSELSKTPVAPSHSVSALSAEDSKPDVQKKRIVSKRLFTTKFRCMICSEVFEKMEDLRDHVRNPCTPGKETSDEKLNRISACEEALKQRSLYPKTGSDKAQTVTKKSLEASRVYECPVCKVLCKTDEEVLRHRFDCLKSKSKPRQRKPKVPATETAPAGSCQTALQTSPVIAAASPRALQDTYLNAGSVSLTTLSPLSSNSCGIVSPMSMTTALVSPMSSAVISPMSTPPPPVVASTSAGSGAIRNVKSVSPKATKVRRVPHTGLLGTRPKPPPKPMTPERIADLLLVWRTVEWVRAALGVAAPSVRIKALDLARSNSVPSTDPPDSKLVEALDIDKSVVAKIKVYEENQRKLKNKKKKKPSPKVDSSLDSIASMKSVAKSLKKEKAPPKKKKEPSHSVVPSTNVKETNVKEPEVKKTEVKKTEVKKAEAKKTEAKKTEAPSDSKQSSPVKRKRPKKKPEPKFQILEHLGRKYYKCGLCGQTFCNLDFMVTEHWEKCLSQNPRQRKTKPGGPGDKKVQKIKTNKEINSVEDKTIPTSAGSVEANPSASPEENKAIIPEPKSMNKPTSITESNNQSAIEEVSQKKSNTEQNMPLPSIPLPAKVDPPHIDFAALLKETFSNALGKRTLDTVYSFDDESPSVTAMPQTPNDTVPRQADQRTQNISNSKILVGSQDFMQKSDVLETNLNFSVQSSLQKDFAEISPKVFNINEGVDLSRPDNEFGVELMVHNEPNIFTLKSSTSNSLTVSKPQGKLFHSETLKRDEDTVTGNVNTNSSVVDIFHQDFAYQDKHSEIKPMDVTLTCNELLNELPVGDIWMEDAVDDKKHSSDVVLFPGQLDPGQELSSNEIESLNPASDLIDENKFSEEVTVEEKITKGRLNDEEYVDDVSCATDKPASDENTSDEKMVTKPSIPTSAENTYKKMIEKPSSSPTSDENSYGDTVIDKPCDSPASDENSDAVNKHRLAENVCEKLSVETDESKENATKGSSTPLGKKRPVLDRDAKNMNSSCTFKLKQAYDSNSGRDVSCDACGALFRHVRTLIQHMVSRHLHPKQWTSSSISSITCPFCSLNCCSYMSYMNHLPKHTTVILEKMGQHLLLDEKKSHSRLKTQDRLAEFLKSKQKKDAFSDLAPEDAKLSQCDSIDDVDVKIVRKRGRPKKQCIPSVKDEQDTKIQNAEKLLNKDNSVHSGFKSMCLPLEDIATLKPHILSDNSVKLSAENISVPNTKTRLRKLRGLGLMVDDHISMVDVEAKSTRSRKSSLSDCDTDISKKTISYKTEQNVPPNQVSRCKTRSRKREASPKKVILTPASPDKRKQTRTNQIRKNLIKAAQAHVVTQRKKAVFASRNSPEKQELKQETNKKKCKTFINKQMEQPSIKSYSLRNSAHLYIKSRQNMIGLHTNPVVLVGEKQQSRVQSNDAKKRELKNTCSNESKVLTSETEASSKHISADDSDVKQDKHSAKRKSSPPMKKKKIRIQFLKRYDETSLCFNKKANCWQAYDRVLKTWKFLSDKHFVQVGHSAKLNDKQNTVEYSAKCVDREKSKNNLSLGEQTDVDAVCEQTDIIVKTENKLITSVEDSCDTNENVESDNSDSLKSPSSIPSFQESYMSYLYQVTENEEDSEQAKQQNRDSSQQKVLKKELKGVKSLRSVTKSKCFKWEVDEESRVMSGNGERVCENLNHSNVMNSYNNPANIVSALHGDKYETTQQEVQEVFGMQTKDGVALLEGIVKGTGNKDENTEQTTSSKSVESDQSSSNATTVSKLVQNNEISPQTDAVVSHVETNDQSAKIVSSSDVSDVKNSTIRQPKSLKVIAARMQTPEACLKSEIVFGVGIKSPALSSSKAEPVEVEILSKSESAVIPSRADEIKPRDGTVPQQSDTEDEEDEKKKLRIERSLKSLREKTNVAPFTWDVDDDDRISCAHAKTKLNESCTNIYPRAISVGTSASDMLTNTRLRRCGDDMKSHVFRKVTRSCSSDSLNLYNKTSPLSRVAISHAPSPVISHAPSPASRVTVKTECKPASGIDIKCKPSKVVLEKSFLSVGSGQSCRTRSCDQRSFPLETFLQRKVKLDNSAADSVNNPACRKRTLSKSEDGPETKHFGMTVSSKESVVRTSQRGNSQGKYSSSKGQQALSSVGSLPAVVRRNSHRLTSPIHSKSSVSNVQFYRVAPSVEAKGVTMRSTRNAATLLDERTRHTLMIGEHVQSGPQLRKSDVKKIDQKWIIDKRKHKKASFPYAFTRKRNQWK